MNALELTQAINRRNFLQRTGFSIGAAAVGLLGPRPAVAADAAVRPPLADFAPRAKRVIYLFQSGAPSQLETFDYKPGLVALDKTDLPDSVRMGQRLTAMTAGLSKFPVKASQYSFTQHGQSGTWLSELMPYTGQIADDICVIRSMHTEAINHDPAITFCQTGSQLPGRPSMGAWIAYGLGSANQNLPAFTVLISRGSGLQVDQPLYDRLWGSGALPGRYQGVKLRSGKDPVFYLANPPGCTNSTRRKMLDQLGELNGQQHEAVGDPEILTRIEQYELAFRMQAAVPDLTDISDEPEHILEMYGPDVRRPGTYA